jgi:hypothetical protein
MTEASLGDWLDLLRSGLLIAPQFVRQLFAHHGELGWRFDTDPHATVANFHHGDCDSVADENPLADFSTEN